MAIANLHESIQSHILRRNWLNLEISNLQTQKSLAVYSQGDLQSLFASEKNAVRDYFKDLFETDETYCEYLDYTEIPDYVEEIDKITARYEEEMERLTAWETAIDTQITTDSTELEEIKAYVESYKSMLTTNIQDDFNFGLNG